MSDPATKWYRDPPVVVSMILGVIGIIAGTGALVRGCAEPPPDLSIVYIVDRSARMDGTIGDKEKFAAVRAEVLEQVGDRPDVTTALRLTGGGPCTRDYRPPTVDYAEDNADGFERALEGVRPRGRSDFARAFVHAVNDMTRDGPAVESQNRTIFVAIGGVDSCAGTRAVSIIDGALRDLRSQEGVDISFKFVGIKPSRAVRKLLRAVRGRVDDLGFTVQTVIANRPGELADAIADVPSPEDEAYDGD